VLNILNKPYPEVTGYFSKIISMLLQKTAVLRADANEILSIPEIASIVKQL
jgi:hypothetical protein